MGNAAQHKSSAVTVAAVAVVNGTKAEEKKKEKNSSNYQRGRLLQGRANSPTKEAASRHDDDSDDDDDNHDGRSMRRKSVRSTVSKRVILQKDKEDHKADDNGAKTREDNSKANGEAKKGHCRDDEDEDDDNVDDDDDDDDDGDDRANGKQTAKASAKRRRDRNGEDKEENSRKKDDQKAGKSVSNGSRNGGGGRHRHDSESASSDEEASNESSEESSSEDSGRGGKHKRKKKKKKNKGRGHRRKESSSSDDSTTTDPSSDGDEDSSDTFFVPPGVKDAYDSDEHDSDYDSDDTNSEMNVGQTFSNGPEGVLFELLPFYCQGDPSALQMVRAALARLTPSQVDVRDMEGNTLLLLACQYRCEDLVEPLLKKGADAQAANSKGVCPMHYAAYSGSLSVPSAELLLRYGALPSTAETTNGCMPLHYAASSGSEALCQLLLDHGADPLELDYYNYTAIQYAADSGYMAVASMLERHAGVLGFAEATAAATEVDHLKAGGLWVRHEDPQSGLPYHMNDETEESWWESDLLDGAKKYIEGGAEDGLQPQVRQWLMQQQVYAYLIKLFGRVDPARLAEVNALMDRQRGRDYQSMIDEMVKTYSISDVSFLEGAFGAKPLLKVEGVPAADRSRQGSGQSEELESLSGSETVKTALSKRGSSVEEAVDVLVDMDGMLDSLVSSGNDGGSSLRKKSVGDKGEEGSMRRVESTMGVYEEQQQRLVDKQLQEYTALEAEIDAQQAKELSNRRERITRLTANLKARKAAVASTKQETIKLQREEMKLREQLGGGNAGVKAQDCLKENIVRLTEDIAGEKAKFEALLEAIDSMKGSAEERQAKMEREENERQEKLRLMEEEAARTKDDIEKESEALQEAAAAQWKVECTALTSRLQGQVTETKAALDEATEIAAQKLALANKTMVEAAKECTKLGEEVEEAKTWIAGAEGQMEEAKKVLGVNRQLHATLRREMEKTKQLHNQIEDMKGPTRLLVRIRPMSSAEQSGGCKELCIKDGNKTVALLEPISKVYDVEAVLTGSQTDLFEKLSSLGMSLVDGHNVCLLGVGPKGAGGLFSLLGDVEGARISGGGGSEINFMGGSSQGAGGGGGGKKGHKKGGGEQSGVSACAGTAGVMPRLLEEVFRVIGDREAQMDTTVHVFGVGLGGGGGGGGGVSCLPAATAADDENGPSKSGNGGDKGKEKGHKLCWLQQNGRRASSAQDACDLITHTFTAGSASLPADAHACVRVAISSANRSSKELVSSDLVVIRSAAVGAGKQQNAWLKKLSHMAKQHSQGESREGGAAAAAAGGDGDDDDDSDDGDDDDDDGKRVKGKKAAWGDTTPQQQPSPKSLDDREKSGKNDSGGEMGLHDVIQPFLTNTAKLVCLLCLGPGDKDSASSQATLDFSEGCKGSSEDGEAQLRKLKKELAKLKKKKGSGGDGEAGSGGNAGRGDEGPGVGAGPGSTIPRPGKPGKPGAPPPIPMPPPGGKRLK